MILLTILGAVLLITGGGLGYVAAHAVTAEGFLRAAFIAGLGLHLLTSSFLLLYWAFTLPSRTPGLLSFLTIAWYGERVIPATAGLLAVTAFISGVLGITGWDVATRGLNGWPDIAAGGALALLSILTFLRMRRVAKVAPFRQHW